MSLYEDMDTVAAMNGGFVQPDPVTDFKLRQVQIANRRKQALDMVAKGMNAPAGQMVGDVYAVNNPWGAFAQTFAGSLLGGIADKQETELALQQRLRQNDTLAAIPAEAGPGRQQAQLKAMQDPSLREIIKAQMGMDENEAKRIDKREDKAIELSSKAEIARETAAARAQERQDQREWQAGQNELYRRTAADQNRRQGSANSDLDRQIKEMRLEQMKAPKPLPAARQKALDDADALLGHIDNAIGLLQANPDAMGAKTMIPDVALQRIDPDGVATRAAVGGLSAAKIHELSGAAVSPAEFARLRPYLPASGDSSETVSKKLAGLRKEAQRIRATHASDPGTQQPSRLKFNPATGRIE